MLLPDVNVLVHAVRADSVDHAHAVGWLDAVHAGSEPVGLCSPVLGGLVRVATHPRIWSTPTPEDVLWDFIEALRSSSLHRFLGAGPRHPDLVRQLCTEADARGNLVADAVIGAISVEHGSTVVSTDRDFARFPSVRWRHPWVA